MFKSSRVVGKEMAVRIVLGLNLLLAVLFVPGPLQLITAIVAIGLVMTGFVGW